MNGNVTIELVYSFFSTVFGGTCLHMVGRAYEQPNYFPQSSDDGIIEV